MSEFYAYVFCDGGFDSEGASISCGQVGLTEQQYEQQLGNPNTTWRCPRCGASAHFDDASYERMHLSVSESAHRWTHDEAVALCRLVEPIVSRFACHIALTGGLLYKEGPRKDCDLIVYRAGQEPGDEERGSFVETVNRDALLQALAEIDLLVHTEYSRVVKCTYGEQSKMVDLIFPELDGVHMSGGEKGTDLLDTEELAEVRHDRF